MSPLTVLDSSNTARSRAAIAVLGDPGAGKTLLSATSELPFFLDVEGRASHARVNRVTPQQTASGFSEIAGAIAELKQSKLQPDGTISYQGKALKTVVLDSIDHLQALCKMGFAEERNKQRMFGKLLDAMTDKILWPLLSLPIHIIVVAHSKPYADAAADNETKGAPVAAPTVSFALEGDLRNRLFRYFDNIFHLVSKQSGETVIVTKPMLIDGRFIMAKDALNIFEGKTIPVTWKDGYPAVDTIKKVFEHLLTDSGDRARLAEINAVKATWLTEAQKVGMLKDHNDGVGMALLKSVLGETYINVTTEGANLGDVKMIGINKILVWRPG